MTFIDNSITSSTGTLALRATMPNKEALLWPGLFVNVELVLTTLQNAIVIPSQCIMIGQQGPYVFVTNSDNTVTRRQVEPGQRHADSTVISKGLNAGDHVVTTGQLTLDDGVKVSPTPYQAPPPVPGRVPSPSPTPEKAK
jgi:membrane fusion protein, multidrug efflux system